MDAFSADVLCLRETHWTEQCMGEIRQRWNGQMYVSRGAVRACGVAILVKHSYV